MATTVGVSLKFSPDVELKTTITGSRSRQYKGGKAKSASITSANANNAAGGGDLVYGPILLTVNASSTTTLDLNGGGLTDNNSNTLAFARIKGWFFHLLSASETAEDGTAGTAASAIKVGGSALGGSGRPLDTASGDHEIKNGDVYAYGGGSAAGWTVSGGSTDEVTIANQDAGVAAKVVVTIWGGSS